MSGGYIKDHRKELDSDIWLMPPLYHRVWQYLKYKVNYSESELYLREGIRLLVKKGQHFTSIREIAKGVAWKERGVPKQPNPKLIGDVLKWLERQNMIQILVVTGNTKNEKNAVNGNTIGTLITLVNWEVYQIELVTSNIKVTAPHVTTGTNNNYKEFTADINAGHDEDFGQPLTIPGKNDLMQLQDTFCNLHGKLDVNLNEKERKLMRQMLDGDKIPVPFIVRVMQSVYQERVVEEGGTISSFLYYKNPILRCLA